jgi:SAM-dependent methyltransferase
LESNFWADNPKLVAFYTTHRCKPEDLYPSERRFLPWLAFHATSVLDVGCAAGGFSQIWKHYRQDIVYTGVDLSTKLIEVAQAFFPGSEFRVANPVSGLPFPDNAFDVVQALGWLFWEFDYAKSLEEMWRITRRWLFFDVRLVSTEADVKVGEQRMTFGDEWDGQSITPYLTLAWPYMAQMLLQFNPKTVMGYGYLGKPSSSVVGIKDEICFGVFVLEKRDPRNMSKATVCVDLPWDYPTDLRQRVNWVPARQLSNFVPEFNDKKV